MKRTRKRKRSKSMSEYIKREDAIQALKNAFDTVPMPYTIADGILKDVPSADVVEVVRCKNCVYFHTTASGVSYCTNQDMMPFADDYCCNAKRKDESK